MTKIITDSSSDFDQEIADKIGLTIIPMNICFADKNYVVNRDITIKEFYEKLEKSDILPQTAQPSPDCFVKVFEEAKKNNDELVVILISSKLSGTIQNAILAKEMVGYDKIYIIDSLTTTIALKVIVDYALKLQILNYSAETIVEMVNDLIPRVKMRLIPGTLDYLYRGGRLSKNARFFGNLLGLKPIIEVTGTVNAFGRARGINLGIKTILEDAKNLDLDLSFDLYFGYTTSLENMNKMEAKVNEYFNCKIKQRINIGPTVGTHLGPNTFGIAFVAKKIN